MPVDLTIASLFKARTASLSVSRVFLEFTLYGVKKKIYAREDCGCKCLIKRSEENEQIGRL